MHVHGRGPITKSSSSLPMDFEFSNFTKTPDGILAKKTKSNKSVKGDGYEPKDGDRNNLVMKNPREVIDTTVETLEIKNDGALKYRKISSSDSPQKPGWKYHAWGYNGHIKSTGKELDESVQQGVAEDTDDIKKRMSKLEALALAANRAGDDAKCKMYQQKIQSLKQKLSQSMAEGSQNFNKVEPYYVCLAGKPVKKFDYYQDARRFHDNWKQKLYREGNKAKADKVTLMPVIDEGIKKSAAATALAACMAAGGTLSGCATNPSVGGAIGTVRDVGTAAKTASTMTRAGVQDELSQELRNFIRAQGGDPGSQNLSLLYKLQKRLQGQKDSQPINEVKDTEAVEQAIIKRIMVAHRGMLVEYGPEKIMTAASDVAYNVGDIGEMGDSDVSGWVKQVQQILGVDA